MPTKTVRISCHNWVRNYYSISNKSIFSQELSLINLYHQLSHHLNNSKIPNACQSSIIYHQREINCFGRLTRIINWIPIKSKSHYRDLHINWKFYESISVEIENLVYSLCKLYSVKIWLASRHQHMYIKIYSNLTIQHSTHATLYFLLTIFFGTNRHRHTHEWILTVDLYPIKYTATLGGCSTDTSF